MLVKRFGVFRDVPEYFDTDEGFIRPERIATVSSLDEAEKEIDKDFEILCARHDCPMPVDTPEKARLAKQNIYFVSEIHVWSP